MELRKINKVKFKEFQVMLNSTRIPNTKLIMQELELDDDMYDLYFRHYYYLKGKRKDKKVVKKVVATVKKTKRQNIPDGYSDWVSDVLFKSLRVS